MITYDFFRHHYAYFTPLLPSLCVLTSFFYPPSYLFISPFKLLLPCYSSLYSPPSPVIDLQKRSYTSVSYSLFSNLLWKTSNVANTLNAIPCVYKRY